jgi:exosome complex RNA-binding protein Rrp4
VGASIILGNNGFIWIYPTASNAEEGVGGFVQNLEEVSVCFFFFFLMSKNNVLGRV